ncbi:hypothetical protein [Ensifer sp. MJa1]|uniref:hypothetical protein n=1 Tax=Ensifer sp. MJa1 TaxID=2919888 RepID=UPI00300A336A
MIAESPGIRVIAMLNDVYTAFLPPAARVPWLTLKGVRDVTDAQLQTDIDRIRQTHTWALVEDSNLWNDTTLWHRLTAAQRMDRGPLLLLLAHAAWPLPDDGTLAAAAAAGLLMLTLRLDGTEIDATLQDEIARLARHGIATEIVTTGSARAFARWPDLPVPRIAPANPYMDFSDWRALNAADLYTLRISALLATLCPPDSAMRKADALSRGIDARPQATLMRLGACERRLVEVLMDQNVVDVGTAALISFCLNQRLRDLLTWGGVTLPPPVRLVRPGADGVTIETLDAAEPGCMPLTYDRFWFHWSMRRPDWLAVAARDGDGQIVGLALLSEPLSVEGSVGRRLLSLSVSNAHRRIMSQGVV